MMKTTPSLWEFSCRIYAQANVQSACLNLQYHHAINTPLLLFCCWSGRYYGAVSTAVLQQVTHFALQWSAATTAPLRQLREGMKSSHDPAWPIVYSEWQTLREQVKAVELETERLLLEGSAQLCMQSRPESPASPDAIRQNIQRCFSATFDSEALENLRLLTEACWID